MFFVMFGGIIGLEKILPVNVFMDKMVYFKCHSQDLKGNDGSAFPKEFFILAFRFQDLETTHVTR